MNRAHLFALALSFTAFGSEQPAQTPSAVAPTQPTITAFVYEIQGDWSAGRERLRKGQGLAEGSVIRPLLAQKAQDSRQIVSFIVLMTLDGKPLRLDCCPVNGTPPSLKVPASGQPEATLSRRIVEAAARIFNHRGEMFATTLARGAEDVSRSGIAKLMDGWLELGEGAPVFQRSGAMLLELWLWPESGAAPSDAKTRITLPLPADQTAKIKVTANLRPGLYRAQPMGATKTGLGAVGRDFYLLVNSPATYEESATYFRQCLAIASGWSNQVSPSGKEEFLRASLLDLASRLDGPGKQ
ncbi:hypothetical protein [Paludibaculum fermentans]|uniref:hypothetical protein n=1 Tax=Paludibaculum fermentans TaxID=1473598 RepID=UPI003EC11559